MVSGGMVHAMHGDINFKIHDVIKVEINWKRKSWKDCLKKDLEQYGLRREDLLD